MIAFDNQPGVENSDDFPAVISRDLTGGKSQWL